MKRELKRLFLVVELISLGAFGVQAQEIATWENWCKSAVTFTFDDGEHEWLSHNWAAQQLENYNFRATFYLVTNWMANHWNDYQNLAQKGHEIGSHTVTHYSTTSELAPSKSEIEQQIHQPCLTIAYPNCNNPGSNAVLSNYIGGRICSGVVNSKSPSDFSNISAIICGSEGINTAEAFQKCCQEANEGWVVFLLHGIQECTTGASYSPTNQNAFTETLSWLHTNEKDYWVCTFRDACMYIKERNNASFKKISGNATGDTYSLTLNTSLTDNKLCKWDYPLSVRVPAQGGWSNIKVTQNNETLESNVSNGYIYFKAVPNDGNIVVSSETSVVPEPEFSIEELIDNTLCTKSVYTINWTMSGKANGRTYSLNFGTGSASTEISIVSVSASSEWESGGTPIWPVDKILSDDGNHGKNARWSSKTGSNEWVEFNLGKRQFIGGMTIDECTDYDVVTDFEVQYDENGSWKTAYKGTTIGNDFKITFPPISTSKVRLFFIKSKGNEYFNINYVKFKGVAGYVIKEGINASGSVEWGPKNTGDAMLTITNVRGEILAQTANIKVENCSESLEYLNVHTSETECKSFEVTDALRLTWGKKGGENSGSVGFDENGAYYGPSDEVTNYTGAYFTGDYTSPFKTILGKSDAEIQNKLNQLWNHYFVGSNKVYFDKGNEEAYILDTYNNDVRSEGMSYGMMICVQTNHKTEFDKLWAFAKDHMWHKSGGQWDGYFAWQCGTDGSVKDQNCAPDGEMHFTMALMFAANRWGDKTYMEDAQYILKSMWKNGNGSLFNEQQNIITFQPYNYSDFSNPSYDLPAFLELFSRWSATNNDKWRQTVSATRDHLYQSSHSSSGLFSDCNNFDGTPKSVGSNTDKYMYDAMRCAMNYGMDYYLFGKDATRQTEMAKRIIDFFEKDNYTHARFNWDGTGGSETYTLGEAGANAVACYCLLNEPSYASKVKNNLKKAWDASLATGLYRYYDGMVHYLAMLHLCGSFKIWKPAPAKSKGIIQATPENTKWLNVHISDEECESFEITNKLRITWGDKEEK